jgi:hypothetical protein
VSTLAQAEVPRKTVAPEEQKLVVRAVRIGHKMRRPAALRNGYKIPAWSFSLFPERVLILTLVVNSGTKAFQR